MAFVFLGVLIYRCPVCAQSIDSVSGKVADLPSGLLGKLQGKMNDLNKGLSNQMPSYLDKLARQEQKLRKRLQRRDSAAAKALFADDPAGKYAALAQRLRSDSSAALRAVSGKYYPYTDSLETMLKFMNKNPQLLTASSLPVGQTLSKLQQVQSKLQTADEARQFIQDRKAQLQQYITQHTQLPSALTNAYKDYNYKLYYYNQQLSSYKDILNDPDKMLKTALVVLNKIPAFTSYVQSNSLLSRLFPAPANASGSQALAGLQTRDQITQALQSQISSGGAGAQSMLGQQISSAQSQLDNLKERIMKNGESAADQDQENFHPNNQATKTFWKRLEYGTNIQTVQSSQYFPTTTDLGLSLGYKLSDASQIGIGVSGKIGWGTGFQHIALSCQGLGLRSSLETKIKGSFSATGGYEYNHQTPFANLQSISHYSGWTNSGLIGISKIVAVKSKVFKKTKVQLLWDFLSYQQVPRTQPILFRISYIWN